MSSNTRKVSQLDKNCVHVFAECAVSSLWSLLCMALISRCILYIPCIFTVCMELLL